MDFTEIFRRMTAGETVPGSVPKTYKVYTVKRKGSITDAMDILRETNNQYVFIRGKSIIPRENGEGTRECFGLLCTDMPADLADIDTMFFVGYTSESENITVIRMPELETYMGDYTKYRIGIVTLISQSVRNLMQIQSFIETVYEMNTRTAGEETEL